ALAYLAYFTALRLGPVSIVSPVIIAYGGGTVILAVVLRGEGLSAPQGLGAALATAGGGLGGGAVGGGGAAGGGRLLAGAGGGGRAGRRGGGPDGDRVLGADAAARRPDPRPWVAARRHRVAGGEQRGRAAAAGRGVAVALARVPAAARTVDGVVSGRRPRGHR